MGRLLDMGAGSGMAECGSSIMLRSVHQGPHITLDGHMWTFGGQWIYMCINAILELYAAMLISGHQCISDGIIPDQWTYMYINLTLPGSMRIHVHWHSAAPLIDLYQDIPYNSKLN